MLKTDDTPEERSMLIQAAEQRVKRLEKEKTYHMVLDVEAFLILTKKDVVETEHIDKWRELCYRTAKVRDSISG